MRKQLLSAATRSGPQCFDPSGYDDGLGHAVLDGVEVSRADVDFDHGQTEVLQLMSRYYFSRRLNLPAAIPAK
jgi:hypothetical protein